MEENPYKAPLEELLPTDGSRGWVRLKAFAVLLPFSWIVFYGLLWMWETFMP